MQDSSNAHTEHDLRNGIHVALDKCWTNYTSYRVDN